MTMMILLGTGSAGGGGGGGDNATLQNANLFDYAVLPSLADVGIRLHSDGTVDYRERGYYSNAYTWLTGTETNADYEARWTTTAGALSSGTTGSWLVLSTAREWRVGGNNTCTGTLEIRMAAVPNTVLATATITLTAETDSGE